MEKLLDILKQRRIWASLLAVIALVLPEANINPDSIINSVVNVIEALSALGAVLLPIWSYLKPKK